MKNKNEQRNEEMKKVCYGVSDSGWEYELSDEDFSEYILMLSTDCKATDDYLNDVISEYGDYKRAFVAEQRKV